MQKIEPHYVDFNTAKLLKKKGFGIPYKQMGYSTKFYNGNTKTMLPLGRTGRSTNLIPAPEQHQVVEWLWLNHGIWIWVEKGRNPDNFYPVIYNGKEITSFKHLPKMWGDTSQEAYSAAFDYVLNNLI